jgi:type I restriction enzyme S subunit
MSSDSAWPRLTLKAAGVSLIDCDHRTPQAVDDGYPYIAIPQLRDGHISLDGVRRISESDYLEWTKKLSPQSDDVIVVRRCNSGESAHVPVGLKCAIGQNLVVLRADGTKVTPPYLRWLVRGAEWWDEVGKYINVGAVFDSLRCRDIPLFELPVPPLQAQKEIAGVLAALDDRITLLRETNATLEAIAQALFKSWFVDFDPVRAKMACRAPEGMDEGTAALFPDALQDTGAGPVPKGWGEQSIDSLVAGVFDGPHATPPEADDGAVFLGIKNLTGTALDLGEVRHIAEADWARWTKRVTPRAGDIVFSYEATLGFFALIPPGLRCCLGRRLALIRPHEQRGTSHFWYHQFVAEPFQRLLAKHTIQGATVDRLALKSFPDLPVLAPPIELRERFDDIAQPIWTRIHQNQSQIGVLSGLRDTLLPRLISGQLRLPETMNLIEEAC